MASSPSQQVRAVFSQYDTDHDGFWVYENFERFLVALRKDHLSPERKLQSWRFLDVARRNKIDMAEFERGMAILWDQDFVIPMPAPIAPLASHPGHGGHDKPLAQSLELISANRTTIRGKKLNVVVKPEMTDPMAVWLVHEKVGEGSYGEIYRATRRVPLATSAEENTAALKVIDLERTSDDLDDLLTEVDFQAKCLSAYLARFYGAWMWERKLYIAMEFLGGGSAEQLLRTCKLNEDICSFILREVAQGLSYMHTNGKIHRDIKAANILFSSTGGVKLADFGVAAQLTADRQVRNTFVGTPLFVAPEIVLSQTYDTAVDVWSYGVMAIELAMGVAPRANQHPMEVLYQIPTSPSPQLGPEFSAEFRDLVGQCLSKIPEQRPKMSELLKSHPFLQRPVERPQILALLQHARQLEPRAASAPKHDINAWWHNYEAMLAPMLPPHGPAAPAPRPSYNHSAAAAKAIHPQLAHLNVSQTIKKRNTSNMTGVSIEGVWIQSREHLDAVMALRPGTAGHGTARRKPTPSAAAMIGAEVAVPAPASTLPTGASTAAAPAMPPASPAGSRLSAAGLAAPAVGGTGGSYGPASGRVLGSVGRHGGAALTPSLLRSAGVAIRAAPIPEAQSQASLNDGSAPTPPSRSGSASSLTPASGAAGRKSLAAPGSSLLAGPAVPAPGAIANSAARLSAANHANAPSPGSQPRVPRVSTTSLAMSATASAVLSPSASPSASPTGLAKPRPPGLVMGGAPPPAIPSLKPQPVVRLVEPPSPLDQAMDDLNEAQREFDTVKLLEEDQLMLMASRAISRRSAHAVTLGSTPLAAAHAAAGASAHGHHLGPNGHTIRAVSIPAAVAGLSAANFGPPGMLPLSIPHATAAAAAAAAAAATSSSGTLSKPFPGKLPLSGARAAAHDAHLPSPSVSAAATTTTKPMAASSAALALTPRRLKAHDVGADFQKKVARDVLETARPLGPWLCALESFWRQNAQFVAQLHTLLGEVARPLVCNQRSSGTPLTFNAAMLFPEDRVRVMFQGPTLLHNVFRDVGQSLEDVLADGDPATIDLDVAKLLEERLVSIRAGYLGWINELTAGLYESIRAIRDVPRFCELLNASTTLLPRGSQLSYYDYIMAPARHVLALSGRLDDLAAQIPGRAGAVTWANMAAHLRELAALVSDAVLNAEALLTLSLSMEGVPLAALLKHGQQCELSGLMERVRVLPGDKLKEHKPFQFVMLKDALIIAKIVNREAVDDVVGLSDLLDSRRAAPRRAPRIAFAYKELWVREFLDASSQIDPPTTLPVLRLDVAVRKGSSATYLCKNHAARDVWVAAFTPQSDQLAFLKHLRS